MATAQEVASLYGLVELRDNATDALDKFENRFQQMGRSFSDFGGKLTRMGAQFSLATAPIAAFGAFGMRTAMDFETVMAELSARTGTTGAELDALANEAMRMGAETVFSAQQAAQAMLELTSSGQTAAEAVATLPYVLDLATAGSLELGAAADGVTDLMAAFGLSVEDAQVVTDALARAAGSSSASVSDLIAGFSNVGPVAAQMGLSVNNTAAILAVFAEAGIKGAEGGTQLRSMLLNMTRDTPGVTAAWEELGTSFYDAEGNVRDLNIVLDEMAVALADMPAEEQNRIMKELGGAYGIIGLQALIAANGFDTMEASMASQASAATVAQAMMNTFGNQLNSLKGSVETLMIVALTPFMNDVLKPMVKDLIAVTNSVTTWAQANPQLTQQIVSLLAVMLLVGPTVMGIGAIISGIGATMTAFGTAWAFISATMAGAGAVGTALSGVLTFIAATMMGTNTAGMLLASTMSFLASPAVLLTAAIAGLLFVMHSMYPGGLPAMFNAATVAAQQLGFILMFSLNAAATWARNSISWLGEKLMEMVGWFEGLWDSVSNGVQAFASGVLEALQPVLEFIDNLIKKAAELVSNLSAAGGIAQNAGAIGAGLASGQFTFGQVATAAVSAIGSEIRGGNYYGGSVMGPTRVGEYNQPELLQSAGKQYLIPGDRGNIIPHGALGGGGGNNITIEAYGSDPYDLAAMVERALRDRGM